MIDLSLEPPQRTSMIASNEISKSEISRIFFEPNEESGWDRLLFVSRTPVSVRVSSYIGIEFT